jgi:hypothetical protein
MRDFRVDDAIQPRLEAIVVVLGEHVAERCGRQGAEDLPERRIIGVVVPRCLIDSALFVAAMNSSA